MQVLGPSPGRVPTHYTVVVERSESQSSCSCPTTPAITDGSVQLTLVCGGDCVVGRHQVYSVTVVAGSRAGSSQSFPGLSISESVLENNVYEVENVHRNDCFQKAGQALECASLLLFLFLHITWPNYHGQMLIS